VRRTYDLTCKPQLSLYWTRLEFLSTRGRGGPLGRCFPMTGGAVAGARRALVAVLLQASAAAGSSCPCCLAQPACCPLPLLTAPPLPCPACMLPWPPPRSSCSCPHPSPAHRGPRAPEQRGLTQPACCPDRPLAPAAPALTPHPPTEAPELQNSAAWTNQQADLDTLTWLRLVGGGW